MSYEQNGREYVTHYKIIEWHSRDDWETLLNQMDAVGGWRVDAHKLEKDFNGCTIFTKSETLKVPLLDASIRVSGNLRGCKQHSHVRLATKRR